MRRIAHQHRATPPCALTGALGCESDSGHRAGEHTRGQGRGAIERGAEVRIGVLEVEREARDALGIERGDLGRHVAGGAFGEWLAKRALDPLCFVRDLGG